MRYLILSDIHSNIEALHAVLTDASGLYQAIVCLGDIVGYGADPNEATDWVRANCHTVIRGNHDRACAGLTDLRFFNPVAKAAAEWTHAQLTPKNLSYLRELPTGPLEIDGFRIAHGSPSDEDEYLISPEDAVGQFEQLGEELFFFGHTHIQGGFKRDGSDVAGLSPYQLLHVDESDALLVNPGSVGQPRDNNWHAAYAIYDASTGQVEFRRCPYDVDIAQAKIVSAGLPPVLAERLGLGL